MLFWKLLGSGRPPSSTPMRRDGRVVAKAHGMFLDVGLADERLLKCFSLCTGFLEVPRVWSQAQSDKAPIHRTIQRSIVAQSRGRRAVRRAGQGAGGDPSGGLP